MSLELEDQYDKIYRYCYFKVNHVQLAEDLTQETFLRYFQQHTYVNHGKTLAYLYTIARNLCIDSYRKQKDTSMEELSLEQCSSESSAEQAKALSQPFPDETISLETRMVCQEAIRTLPEEVQELLLLRYANDLGFAQISAITGLSRFSARRKISAALTALRGILREEDFYE